MNVELILKIESYLRQLSPHMVERRGPALLREALLELKKLCNVKEEEDHRVA